MKYSKFFIKNFKGINELEIDLDKFPNGKIFPLVGLNESGKTTILEALDLFQNRFKEGEEYKMIHKNKQGAFDEDISIEATLRLDDTNRKIIAFILEDSKLEIENPLETITITKKYSFNNSNLKEKGYEEIFNFNLNVKSKNAKYFVSLREKNNVLYENLKEKIMKLIPKILYFEDFLFDFPERIYLERVENSDLTKTETQEEYREVLQDILSSINNEYDLQEHIIKRIKSPGDSDKESLKQILNQMTQKLNSTIVNSWQEIFPKSNPKSIEIEYSNDADKYYLQFKVKEGGSSFSVNERSLGFRWFFGFLLFTRFRTERLSETGEYLFLFDEPANNLHQKSQQKLLSLFEKIVDKSKIIYSTHSHFLINPKSLLNAFVVIDKGIKENEEEELDLERCNQDIKAEYYRIFVGNNENQETHFQPILDCLEYIENPFNPSQNVVFVEGKYDYYTFKWIKELFYPNLNFGFYPGASVQKYEKVFREYLVNNKKFLAIFDSDKAGRDARKNYIEEISIELEKIIFTLKDINVSFSNLQTEKLFSNNEKLKIQKIYYPQDKKYNKRHFNFSIQQLFIEKKSYELNKKTKDNFKKIFDFIELKFKELEDATN